MVKIPRQSASVPQTYVDHVLNTSNDRAVLFAALGDENRLRLVALLRDEGRLSITRLTGGSKITRQAITKHLYVLEAAGLVRCSWHGRETLWRLDQRRFEDARLYLAQLTTVDHAVRAGPGTEA